MDLIDPVHPAETPPAEAVSDAGPVLGPLRAALDGARAEDRPFAFLCLRLDHLERVPDPFRREEALAEFGRSLEKVAAARAAALVRAADLWWLCVPDLDGDGPLDLARELIAGARDLGIDEPDAGFFATVSAGLARGAHRSRPSATTCLAVAREGLEVAEAAGGGRAVHSEVYASFSAVGSEPAFADLAWVRRPERLRDVVLEAPAAPVQVAEVPAPSPAPVDEVAPTPPVELAPVSGEEDQHILERRLVKLSRALEETEAENARLRERLRAEHLGIASIYREVQGLQDGEPFGDLKRDLMRRLFVQNVHLRDQVSHGA